MRAGSERDRLPGEAQASALGRLFEATTALFHRLRAAAAQVHGQGELTAGRRGVLRDLERFGPQTVPQMARRRPVSRQHIQTLVNGLIADGLTEAVENPAHRRSRLVRLTASGRALVEAMRRREARILAAIPLDLGRHGTRDLERAAEVLNRVRAALEGSTWRAARGGTTMRGDLVGAILAEAAPDRAGGLRPAVREGHPPSVRASPRTRRVARGPPDGGEEPRAQPLGTGPC